MKYSLEFDDEALYKEDTRLQLDVIVVGGRFENDNLSQPFVKLELTDIMELP